MLGSWPNAPLALVIAAINTSKVTTLGKAIGALQERLAQDFPELINGVAHNVTLGGQGMVATENIPAWLFISEDRTSAAVFRPDLVALQSTGYKNWEQFKDQIRAVMTAYAATVPVPVVGRIGLRYIDLIVPRDGEAPEMYVQQGMRGATTSLAKSKRAVVRTQTTQLFSDSSGMSVTYTSDDAADAESPVFQELTNEKHLAKSEVMARAIAHSGNVASLDIDRWEQTRSKFDVASILSQLEAFHDHQRKAIDEVATPHALAVWQGRTG